MKSVKAKRVTQRRVLTGKPCALLCALASNGELD